MVTKGIYLFWDKKYEQVIYAGRFTGRKRIKDHFRLSRKHDQRINEYVQANPSRIVSIIFCEFNNISNDDLNQLEKESIRLFKLNKYKYPDSFVFNFTDGGDGICSDNYPNEIKQKISKKNTGKNNGNWGNPTNYKHSEETIEKISRSKRGQKPSIETRKKLSELKKGEKNCQYRHDIPSPQELLDEYNSTNITRNGLAIKYNCSKATIDRRLRKAKR